MHAAPQDFCAIFMEDMSALYSLAFLLTADHEAAEQCFLAALDDCLNGAQVVPERTRSWSRRAVVKQAIRVVNPKPGEAAGGWETSDDVIGDDVRARLLQLPAFERFVFAMAVLERYSIHECAVLLNCRALDVERARIEALQSISEVHPDLQPVPVRVHDQGPRLVADIGAA
jgi:hypothetical protein